MRGRGEEFMEIRDDPILERAEFPSSRTDGL